MKKLIREAEQAKADQRVFSLNQKQFNDFLFALNADPVPNAALYKLLHTK